jgi:hypothetical protein
MSIQPVALAARAREPRSRRAHRYVARCQVRGCRARACEAIEVELPATWEPAATYTVLVITVGACREHARELRRRIAAILQMRADLRGLLAIVEAAAMEGDR